MVSDTAKAEQELYRTQKVSNHNHQVDSIEYGSVKRDIAYNNVNHDARPITWTGDGEHPVIFPTISV